jgi:hypothetical protein
LSPFPDPSFFFISLPLDPNDGPILPQDLNIHNDHTFRLSSASRISSLVVPCQKQKLRVHPSSHHHFALLYFYFGKQHVTIQSIMTRDNWLRNILDSIISAQSPKTPWYSSSPHP